MFVQHALLPCRCLVDSIGTRSMFEERLNSSELRLSLQAFKFDDADEVSKTDSSEFVCRAVFLQLLISIPGVYPLQTCGLGS